MDLNFSLRFTYIYALTIGLTMIMSGPHSCAIADYIDPFPSYTGSNLLLEGSSFETGMDGFGYSRKMYYRQHLEDGFAFVPLEYDMRSGYVMHGSRSLKLVNDSEDCISIDYHWVPLEPDSFYVISFWAKAEKNPGEPEGNMVIAAKIIGKDSTGNYTSPFQQSFNLGEDWVRFVSDTIVTTQGELQEDLAYLQFFTGPWYSGQPDDAAARLHGTIWLDGISLAPAGAGSDYEFPPDEMVEIGAWSLDEDGPRTGNLFYGSDNVIRAHLLFYSDTFTGSLDVDYSMRDSYGNIIHQDTLSGVDMNGGSATATVEIRLIVPPLQTRQPFFSPMSTGGACERAGTPRSSPVDLLEGRKGIFRFDFVARESGGGETLGSEEMLLCVIDPDTSGADQDSPFGTHVHYMMESTQNGFPGTPDGYHDHVIVSSWPQEYIFGAIRDAGFKWVRDFTFASWAAVQPDAGEWNFCDHNLDYCEAFGLQLMPILGWTAPWWAAIRAKGDPFVDWQEARTLVYPGYWNEFVFNTIDNYKDRIRIWEICNEPYFYYSVEQYYNTFLAPAAEAVGRIEGASPLLAGPAGGIPWWTLPEHPEGNFIDSLFSGFSAGEELDILTEHFYVKKDPPFEDGFYNNSQSGLKERIQDYLDAYVGDNEQGSNTVLAVWDGESGQVMPTLRSDTRVHALDHRHYPYDERNFLDEMSGNFELSCLISAYLVRAYVIELAYGAERFFQHTFFGKGSPAEAGGQRLIGFDGTPNHGYAALTAMMARLRGIDSADVHCIEGGSSPDTRKVRAYTFRREEIPVSVVYDYGEDDTFPTLDIDLDPVYLTAYDMMGNEFLLDDNSSGGFSLQLSNLPQYLEGDGSVVDFDSLTTALEEALITEP